MVREPIWDDLLDILQNPESGGEHLVRSAVVESVREVRSGRWVVLCSFLVVIFWNTLDGVGGGGGAVGEKQVGVCPGG